MQKLNAKQKKWKIVLEKTIKCLLILATFCPKPKKKKTEKTVEKKQKCTENDPPAPN